MIRFPFWQACLLLLAISTAASADIVTLKSGRLLEGLVEETKTGDLRVTTALGAVLVPRKDVLRVKRVVPAWKVLETRLAAHLAGDLNDALEIAIYAIAHDMRRKTPAILKRGLVPGDVRGALRALKFCEQNRVSRGLELLARHGVGDEGPLLGGPVDAAELGRRCLRLKLPGHARRLFLFALKTAPRLPEAERGLVALDFQRVRGRWVAPEVYYPARGYQQFRNAWRLPAEITALRADDALASATSAVAAAQSTLKRRQRDEARARSRRSAALSDRTRETTALESGRVALASFEADLTRADARRRDARRTYDGWCAREPRRVNRVQTRGTPAPVTPIAVTLEWRRRRVTLNTELKNAERELERARTARDRQLGHLQDLTRRVGDATSRLANADAKLAGSAGRIASAQTALERTLEDQRAAKRTFDAAARDRDLALAEAAKAKAKER